MVDTVGGLAARNAGKFSSMVERVRLAGTDNLSHFGNGYTEEGGLSLQQNPDEFAALVLFLEAQDARSRNYLEIGSASGGALVFIERHAGPHKRLFSIDDGGHHRYPELGKNFAKLNAEREQALCEPVRHLRADSHGVEAQRWLYGELDHGLEKLDTIFIDGDHSEQGVWQDVVLTRDAWRPGTIVILHDIVACDGVKKAWQRGARENLWVPYAEYIGAERPLGIGIGLCL